MENAKGVGAVCDAVGGGWCLLIKMRVGLIICNNEKAILVHHKI